MTYFQIYIYVTLGAQVIRKQQFIYFYYFQKITRSDSIDKYIGKVYHKMYVQCTKVEDYCEGWDS